MSRSHASDVVIAGGGIIGLSLGLELRRRGASVTVVERDHAMRSASWAAGGMLAAHDPENPAALLPLSLYSLILYPEYLEHVEKLSGQHVPLRTSRTLQQMSAESSTPQAHGERADSTQALAWIPGLTATSENFIWLQEASLDPRDLCRALPLAFTATKGTLLEGACVLGIESRGDSVTVHTSQEQIECKAFVNCCGAWAGESRLGGIPVEPVKGQMVTVALPPERLRCVLRTPDFYVIPRGDGRATAGATIEHVGFDQAVEQSQIANLLKTIARLLPEIQAAPQLESWAGLRPGTPDGLPILGPGTHNHCWHATGHYRNGVLLAPVTARVMAQAILGEQPDLPLDSFLPSRFSAPSDARPAHDAPAEAKAASLAESRG